MLELDTTEKENQNVAQEEILLTDHVEQGCLCQLAPEQGRCAGTCQRHKSGAHFKDESGGTLTSDLLPAHPAVQKTRYF